MKHTRRITSLLGTAVLTSAAALSQTAPPMPPLLVSYQYWPMQYLQFVTGAELPYSMFELDVNTSGKQPVYHAVLTGKDGSRTHYSNADSVVAAYKAQGEPSFKAGMAFEGEDTQKVGAVTTVRFRLADGRPCEFRFVQGSELGEQGAGIQPLPAVPVPVFVYREAGAIAGEGTALKIGETVSTAEAWTEISHPPQFIAYRGAVTQDAHTLVLTKGAEHWKVASTPTVLTTGAAWELSGDHGMRHLRIDRVDGAHFTFSGTDQARPGTGFSMEATRSGDTWQIERIRYAPIKDGDKHYLTLTMQPSGNALEITAGKKVKIASATLTVTGTITDRTTAVKITAPAWASGKALTEEAITSADGSSTLTAR